MDQNVIYNIASNYVREFGLMDRLDELKELVKNHGDEPFYIFRYMSFVKNFLIIYKKWNVYHRSSQSKEISFLEDLKKKCYIQVKKRKVEKEPLNSEFLDEIYFTINVFK